MTALFVTHDQEEALSLADPVAVIWRADRQLGSPDEVYEPPASRTVAEFLGEVDLSARPVSAGVIECELGSFAGRAGRRRARSTS